jgi:hypothetical protein
MKQQVLEKQKTYVEQLDEIPFMGQLDITDKNRQMFANTITALHRDTDKQFIIRRDKITSHIIIWRLK